MQMSPQALYNLGEEDGEVDEEEARLPESDRQKTEGDKWKETEEGLKEEEKPLGEPESCSCNQTGRQRRKLKRWESELG